MRALPILLLPLALLAEDAPRSCTLRLAWWSAPAANTPPVLAIGPDVRNPSELAPQVMNFTTEARCLGDVAELLIKRVSKDAKTGKDVVSWDPFASVPLPKGEDTLGVIMIADANVRQGQGRAFHLGTERFPMGSIRLINLTGRELMLGLDGQGVRVAPGNVATHPRLFRKPEVAEVSVAASVNGEPRPVFTTKSEFSGAFRLVLFVAEIPESNPPKFEVRTIVDFPQPDPKPAKVDPAGKAAPAKTR